MIAKLYGTVDTLFADRVYLRVRDTVYSVFCSRKTLTTLEMGKAAVLWVEHIFRADDQLLCGFLSFDEQLCFRDLTNVQGVGAKVALAVLSTFTPTEFAGVILSQDKELLKRVEGVGPKMAERMLIELKNSKVLRSYKGATEAPLMLVNDAVEALVALGYDRLAAEKTVEQIEKANPLLSTEDLIRTALAHMSRLSF